MYCNVRHNPNGLMVHYPMVGKDKAPLPLWRGFWISRKRDRCTMDTSEQFKNFNPLSGVAPFQPFEWLPEIASRARVILKSRSAEQIENAAYNIDWAIDDYFRSVKLEGGLDIPTAENTSEVDALKVCIAWWDDMGGEYFPDGKPQEIFATLSLWLLADALKWIRYQRNDVHTTTLKKGDGVNYEESIKPTDFATNYSLAGAYALKAMDAVCYAEHLLEMTRLESFYKSNVNEIHGDYQKKESERKSIASEKLNIARHRTNHDAKAKVIEEWEKERDKFPSAAKYGIYLADRLKGPGFGYEPSTVTGWIRTHAKQIGVKLR